jgi:hypothetical protein
MTFPAHFALCFGRGERFSLFFPVEQGNPELTACRQRKIRRAQKGPPLVGPALFVATPLAPQLCQRNACGLRAEPWLSTMLTSAGPRKFIASSRAPRMCFGSSTKNPFPPKASMTRS